MLKYESIHFIVTRSLTSEEKLRIKQVLLRALEDYPLSKMDSQEADAVSAIDLSER